ncbi:hypothetical protein [Paenibacillus senegalensis]|uniref:hypothetical protein n=1 Tax=Paenibacillus senegalensis TaxID=1465766 RepID=UPI0002883798|nr:hypothetical protein [Paenibacillus senegalensis]
MGELAYVTPRDKLIINHISNSGKAPKMKSKNILKQRLNKLLDQGLIKRLDRGVYEVTDKPYVVVLKRPIKINSIKYRVNLSQSQIDYILANYMLYRRKRGLLAAQLGLSRLDLNFAIMDLGLCSGDD